MNLPSKGVLPLGTAAELESRSKHFNESRMDITIQLTEIMVDERLTRQEWHS